MKGRVYKSTGSWYRVRDENGNFLDCRIKGKLRLKGIKSTNPVAVGDEVVFALDTTEGEGIIREVTERRNAVIRKSANLSKQVHILAANIDLCLLFVTVEHPHTTMGFIDRFLVSSEAFGVPVRLVFNKTDLYDTPELRERLQSYLDIYRQVGYRCAEISVEQKRGLDTVIDWMKDKTVVVSGHSGTGKSSFLQYLDPNLEVRIGATSDVHKKGKHTTTFAEMFDLPYGIRLIDTPGIKGFGLAAALDKDDINLFFPEMKALLPDCKFYNCKHQNEPGCAVKEAVERGEIPESRFFSYCTMMEDDGSSYRKNIYG